MYKSFQQPEVVSKLERQLELQRRYQTSSSEKGKPLLECRSGRMLYEQSQEQAARKREKEQGHKNRDTFELFFGTLLDCSASLYLEAGLDTTASKIKWTTLWKLLCHLLGINDLPSVAMVATGAVAESKYKTKFSSVEKYFQHRAALVVEEARYVISQSLVDQHPQHHQQQQRKKSTTTTSNNLATSIVVVQTKRNFHSSKNLITYEFSLSNNPHHNQRSGRLLENLRPGTIVQCLPYSDLQNNNNSTERATIQQVVLGCIGGGSSSCRFQENDQKLQVLVSGHHFYDDNKQHQLWILTPLANLVSEYRQIDSLHLSRRLSNGVLPFRKLLLGNLHSASNNNTKKGKQTCVNKLPKKRPKGTDPTTESPVTTPTLSTSSSATSSDTENDSNANIYDMVDLPVLNDRQEQIVQEFLSSPKGSISLTQGPPGTGKTTMLVNLLLRYLLTPRKNIPPNNKRALMVAAPTNKAVTVLASRYMYTIGNRAPHVKAVLVGDADKLIFDGGVNSTNGSSDTDCCMKSIFVYQFFSNLLRELKLWQSYLKQERADSTPTAPLKRLLIQTMDVLPEVLKLQCKSFFDTQQISQQELLKQLDTFITTLAAFKNDSRKHREMMRGLVQNSDVIFCTLASSGSSIFKTHNRSDDFQIADLIVDEAAAATEMELAIPFHLLPNRLCVVGDPKQLPAAVSSPRARALGMEQSLHDRLLFHCQYNYIMLNKQYRMARDISFFPSVHFYSGELKNSRKVKSSKYASPRPVLKTGRSCYFQQVDGKEERRHHGSSFSNLAEAEAVVDWVRQLQKKAEKDEDVQWHHPDKLRVITFYRGQVELIKRLLQKEGLGSILVETVDSSQGCEADLVIISFVRSCSNDNYTTKNRPAKDVAVDQQRIAGFLTDDRRINVAITRAKYELICIGNRKNMCVNDGIPTLQKLAQDAQSRGLMEETNISTLSVDEEKHNKKKRKQERKNQKKASKRLKLSHGDQ